MEGESKMFTRTFIGYQPAAVDAHVEMLATKQQLLLDDVESLRAKLSELGDETVALRKEVALLTDTSPSPHAVQKRMAQMLRRAVDEVSEMRVEAQAEADATVTAAEVEAEAVTARREVMEAEYAEAKAILEHELGELGADAHQARERLLAEAKREADHYREEAQRAVTEASQRRIDILEQLMGVYRDLEDVPATLESAYRALKNPSDLILGAVSTRTSKLTAPQARRIAVAAQGFNEPHPNGPVTRAHLRRVISRIQVLQTGLGVRRGASPLRARVQPAGALRPRRAGSCRVGAHRTLAPVARRVLGARGRVDGRRRLAADALADGAIPARPLGHAHRQSQPETR